MSGYVSAVDARQVITVRVTVIMQKYTWKPLIHVEEYLYMAISIGIQPLFRTPSNTPNS